MVTLAPGSSKFYQMAVVRPRIPLDRGEVALVPGDPDLAATNHCGRNGRRSNSGSSIYYFISHSSFCQSVMAKRACNTELQSFYSGVIVTEYPLEASSK